MEETSCSPAEITILAFVKKQNYKPVRTTSPENEAEVLNARSVYTSIRCNQFSNRLLMRTVVGSFAITEYIIQTM